MLEYDHKPEKVIRVGDPVFDKIETINITLEEIKRDLGELIKTIDSNNERLREIKKGLRSI